MACLGVRDDAEYISFSDGAVPAVDVLIRCFPAVGRGRLPLTEMPADEEEQRARLLSFHAAQIAAARGYDCETQPPLETWLVGPPRGPHALFSPWFEGMPDAYRLFIHRCPLPDIHRAARCRRYDSCWRRTYERIGLRGRRGQVSQTLISPVREFLQEVLFAYRMDSTLLPGLFGSVGHLYTHSAAPRLSRV